MRDDIKRYLPFPASFLTFRESTSYNMQRHSLPFTQAHLRRFGKQSTACKSILRTLNTYILIFLSKPNVFIASIMFFCQLFFQVHPKSLSMTDSSSWKLIKLRTLIPIRSHARRNSAVVINLQRHGRFVADKCSFRLTETNRKKYGFYIKPVRDFRRLKRRNIRVRFRPIRTTPGLCSFWKGYRLPSIKVNNHIFNQQCSVSDPYSIVTGVGMGVGRGLGLRRGE